MCNYKSHIERDLRAHKIVHENRIRINCELCEYSALKKSSIIEHTKSVHEGINYDCGECGKVLSTAVNLKTHKKRKHNNGKMSLNCKICDKSFYVNGDLTKHIEKYHKEKIFNCDQCEYSASLNSSLTQHISRCHGDPIVKIVNIKTLIKFLYKDIEKVSTMKNL